MAITHVPHRSSIDIQRPFLKNQALDQRPVGDQDHGIDAPDEEWNVSDISLDESAEGSNANGPIQVPCFRGKKVFLPGAEKQNDFDSFDFSDISAIQEENLGDPSGRRASSIPKRVNFPPPAFQNAAGLRLFADTKNEIRKILLRCQASPKELAKLCGLKTTDYYAIWGSLLNASAIIGSSVPKSFSLASAAVNSVVRPGFHAGAMDDTRLNSRVARHNEINDCARYFNLKNGIQQLAEWKEVIQHNLSAPNLSSGDKQMMDKCLSLIDDNQKKLEMDACKLEATARAPLSKINEEAKGLVNFVRGTVIGTPNSGNAILQSVSAGLKIDAAKESMKLAGRSLQFANTVSGISAALSIASAATNITSASLELHGARSAKKVLSKESLNDKRICAEYGFAVPALQDLARLRQDKRSVKSLSENLMIGQGSVRLVHSATSLAAAGLGIATLAGVSAATFGAAPAALGAVAGLYFFTIQARQWMSTKQLRTYDKEIERMAALYQHNTIPGLSLSSDMPGAHNVADDLARVLVGGGNEASSCRRALIEMGLPKSSLDVTGKDATQVAKQIFPHLFASGALSDQEVIEKRYSECKTASDAVNIMAYQIENKDVAAPEKKAWHGLLASGADAIDIRKSEISKKDFAKNWQQHFEFRDFVKESLSLPQEMEDAEKAWLELQKAKKTAEEQSYENMPSLQKEVATKVLQWMEARDLKAIKQCLSGKSEKPFDKACKNKLDVYFSQEIDITPRETDTALYLELETHELSLDTIHMFKAAAGSHSPHVQKSILEKTQDLVDQIRAIVHEDDKSGFQKAIGIVPGQIISSKDLPLVLNKLEKFLLISRRLQGENLEKVIASLHKYPTAFSGVPTAIVREAARLEIRRRFPMPADPAKAEDFRQTMRLAHELREIDLEKRGPDAGNGGGVLLWGGFKLNDKGLLIKNLLENSKAGGAPNGVLSGSLLKELVKEVPASKEALVHWAAKSVGEKPGRSIDYLARELDLLYKPEALEEALNSKKGPAYNRAKEVFEKKFEKIRADIHANAKLMNDESSKDRFDASSFVKQMQEYFELQNMGEKHLLIGRGAFGVGGIIVLGEPLTQESMKFYREALLWKDPAGRDKNVKAIEHELTKMKEGDTAAANHLWSIEFLKKHPSGQRLELNKLKDDSPWLQSKAAGASYEGFVKEYRALGKMSPKQVHAEAKSGSDKMILWLNWFAAESGLSLDEKEIKDWANELKAISKDEKAVMEHLAKKRDNSIKQGIQTLLNQCFGLFADDGGRDLSTGVIA